VFPSRAIFDLSHRFFTLKSFHQSLAETETELNARN